MFTHSSCNNEVARFASSYLNLIFLMQLSHCRRLQVVQVVLLLRSLHCTITSAFHYIATFALHNNWCIAIALQPVAKCSVIVWHFILLIFSCSYCTCALQLQAVAKSGLITWHFVPFLQPLHYIATIALHNVRNALQLVAKSGLILWQHMTPLPYR